MTILIFTDQKYLPNELAGVTRNYHPISFRKQRVLLLTNLSDFNGNDKALCRVVNSMQQLKSNFVRGTF